MMSHCQSYINKIFYLSEYDYPNYDVPVYKLEAKIVEDAYVQGFLPDIRLQDIKEDGRVKIAVILGQDKHPDREEKDFTIHPAYVKAIIDAGGYPLFFTYDKVKETLERYHPQGILLIGGFFYSPKEWYVDDEKNDIDKRGQAYLETLNFAKEHKLPLLGICAGMQMLGGFCGAKLEKGHKEHLIGGDVVAHKVKVKDSTLLAKISGEVELAVNSHHSEVIAINKLGDCILSAQSNDGIVEAIELKYPWNDFVLGLQWHPERDFPNSAEFRDKLFSSFIIACRK